MLVITIIFWTAGIFFMGYELGWCKGRSRDVKAWGKNAR